MSKYKDGYILTADELSYFPSNTPNIPINRRVRRGAVIFMISATAIVDAWLSIWYQMASTNNTGSVSDRKTWTGIVETDSRVAGLSVTTLDYSIAIDLGPTDVIQFGLSTQRLNGSLEYDWKTIKEGMLTVRAINI